MWKIEKVISKGEYNYCTTLPKHPNSTEKGYVLEHRVIMENVLSRLLNSEEIVHHKNGNKKDNRPENLEVMMRGNHSRMHGLEKGRKMATLKCPSCKSIFVRPQNKTHLIKSRGNFTCCSSSCRGKFSRFIQMCGRTYEVDRAISENIVVEFISTDNPEQTNC